MYFVFKQLIHIFKRIISRFIKLENNLYCIYYFFQLVFVLVFFIKKNTLTKFICFISSKTQ